MSRHTSNAISQAITKNVLVILGVIILTTAWIIEKKAIASKQKQVENSRLKWDQYRIQNSLYALVISKFETMRFIELATSNLLKDSIVKSQSLLQLRFALFDYLRLRTERDEAIFLLEKDPINDDTAKMLYLKRVEVVNAFNSKDINQLYKIHERDNDYSFNNAERRTKQYVREYNELLESSRKTEVIYLIMYGLGSLLIVLQKIKDTVYRESYKTKNSS